MVYIYVMLLQMGPLFAPLPLAPALSSHSLAFPSAAPPPSCLPAAVPVTTVMAVIMLQLGHPVLGRGNKGFSIIRYCSQKAF